MYATDLIAATSGSYYKGVKRVLKVIIIYYFYKSVS